MLKTSSDKSSTARAFAVKMSTLVPVRRVLMFVRLVYRWDYGSSRAALLAWMEGSPKKVSLNLFFSNDSLALRCYSTATQHGWPRIITIQTGEHFSVALLRSPVRSKDWSESWGRWGDGPFFFLFLLIFVEKHQNFKSDSRGYKKPVEGIEQWGKIEWRLKTVAFWLIYRVSVAHKGRSARSYLQ